MYALKKLGTALLSAFLVTVVTFVLLRLTPGDAIHQLALGYAQQYHVSIEQAYDYVEKYIDYNPSKPLYQQLLSYLWQLVHGNLGMSMLNGGSISVNRVIANSLPWTLFVSSVSLFFSFLIGILLGTRMAWKRTSILEPLISIYTVITSAVPDFIIAILLLVFFAYGLNWFPFNGAYGSDTTPGFNLPFIASVLYHSTLPIVTFVLTHAGAWALQMKGNAISVIGEDYIVAAKARGVSDDRIMSRYVRRNAMLPMVASVAVTFGYMMSGAVLIESSFQFPGMGFQLGLATGQRDYTTMQGLLLVVSLLTVLANFVSDLIYSKLDPRIKEEG
ncbi:MAG: ABC transporter permease [Alicyclobacillus sp.]|nr:ABC transporter permease [Alicyclobacillus sp.]